MVNDKGPSIMKCGLYIGIGETAPELSIHDGTEIPNTSTSINITVVDLLAEVTLSFKFTNPGDLPINPTFVFPLDNLGVLCDVEITVGNENRLSGELDIEAFKRTLQQNDTHLIKFGEVAPHTETTIKCTYISLSSFAGDAIKFVLPAQLIPTLSPQPSDEPNSDKQRVSLSVSVHDKFISVTSTSHPDSIGLPLVLSGGTKADVEVKVPNPFSTDLELLVRANNIKAPRAWTSAGTSGPLLVPARVNMFVLCPPFRELEGVTREGEVILFLDVRESDQANVEQVLTSSLEKLPKWAKFNVLASFDGTSFVPIFESGAVPVTEESLQQAVEKIKTYTPFTGDEGALLSCVQTILSGPSTASPRLFYFVTSMGTTHLDDVLKLIITNSATTRGVVVSLKSKWKDATLPLLLTLNGGHVVQSTLPALGALLPSLIETYTQPTQPLSITHTLRPVHQFPQTAQQLYLNTANLSFGAYFEHLTNSGEIEVRGTDTNGDKIHQLVRPKETNSQVLHRLMSYVLLSELKVGLHQAISASQADALQTIMYSKFEYKLMTPKGESGGRLPLPDKSQSVSSAISSFRSGSYQKTPAGAGKFKTMPEKDVRGDRLGKHNSIKTKHEVSEVDYIERLKINFSELEPQALEFGIEYIKEALAPARQLTAADSASLRNIVMAVIEDTSSICPDGQAVGVFLPKLKTLVQSALKEKWKPEDDESPSTYEVCVFQDRGSRTHMEDQHCLLDSASALLGLTSQPRVAFFGVFDGHSGRHAAEFTKVNLPFNVLRNTNFDTQRMLLKQEYDVITEGYVKTDGDFLAIAENADYKSGTTAVTIMLTDSHMIVSNVGDSEAILSRGGQAVQLSTLHKPLNEKEKQRVTEAGGTIVHYGTLRVNGVLAVTRSIGDRALKAHVPANPDTVIEKITEKDEFVVLASDGLWEVMKYQEVVDFVAGERAKMLADPAQDPRNAAHRLVDEALRKETKDNITVLIVFFKHSTAMQE